VHDRDGFDLPATKSSSFQELFEKRFRMRRCQINRRPFPIRACRPLEAGNAFVLLFADSVVRDAPVIGRVIGTMV
jgi:hypothetical protein